MDSQKAPETTEPDDGLRKMLTWTFVALVASLLFCSLGVYLVTRWFA